MYYEGHSDPTNYISILARFLKEHYGFTIRYFDSDGNDIFLFIDSKELILPPRASWRILRILCGIVEKYIKYHTDDSEKGLLELKKFYRYYGKKD